VSIAADIARCLDPVQLAEGIGMTPDPWQADVLRSDHPRILLNCSRQSGKSVTCAVKAVHVAVYEPGALILLLSPSQRQSGELFRKVLATYKTLGRPIASEAESALTITLENGSRIVSLPGTEATIRAYSAVRLLLVDEASRVDDSTMSACRPFLAVSGGQLIALSTPAGKRGWWHDAWEDGGNAYMRVCVPASSVPRISAEFLEQERLALGEWAFKSEYECSFESCAAASVFRDDDIEAMFREDVELWKV
jgi:hypothetical protein